MAIKRRPILVWLLLGAAIVLQIGLVVSRSHAGGCPGGWNPVIVGFAHSYDVMQQRVCGPYGCRMQAVQIPCQHPIWGCP